MEPDSLDLLNDLEIIDIYDDCSYSIPSPSPTDLAAELGVDVAASVSCVFKELSLVRHIKKEHDIPF